MAVIALPISKTHLGGCQGTLYKVKKRSNFHQWQLFFWFLVGYPYPMYGIFSLPTWMLLFIEDVRRLIYLPTSSSQWIRHGSRSWSYLPRPRVFFTRIHRSCFGDRPLNTQRDEPKMPERLLMFVSLRPDTVDTSLYYNITHGSTANLSPWMYSNPSLEWKMTCNMSWSNHKTLSLTTILRNLNPLSSIDRNCEKVVIFSGTMLDPKTHWWFILFPRHPRRAAKSPTTAVKAPDSFELLKT